VELSGPDGVPLHIHRMTDEELERQLHELVEQLNLQKHALGKIIRETGWPLVDH
jgi:hypothetical protein